MTIVNFISMLPLLSLAVIVRVSACVCVSLGLFVVCVSLCSSAFAVVDLESTTTSALGSAAGLSDFFSAVVLVVAFVLVLVFVSDFSVSGDLELD